MPDELPLGTHLELNRLRSDQRLDARVSTETQEEQASRLRIKEKDATADRCIRVLTFIALLVGVFGVGVLCVRTMYAKDVTVEQKTWAQSTLSALIAGAIFFVTGRASAGKRKEE